MDNILPLMVSVSNNSHLTQSVAVKLQEKLDKEELAEFQRWLMLVNVEVEVLKRDSKRVF
jgi:hypothetical protein